MPAGNSPQFDLKNLQSLVDDGVLLLTPNQRLARHIKSAWDHQQIASGKSTWQPVAVRALAHWLGDCWQQAVDAGRLNAGRVLSALQEKELWRLVIEADLQANGEYSLLQPASAVELAKQGREQLLRAQVDLSVASIANEFTLDPDCDTFLRWLKAYNSRLQRAGLLTADERIAALAALEPVSRKPRVALVDFDDLPPLHRACITALADEVLEVASASGQAPLHCRSYPDRESELAAVASWAAQQYSEDPERTVGILLADMNGDRAPIEYLLRREFDCLGERYASLPVNFSTGISLDRAPVIRDALRMLASCGSQLAMSEVLGLVNTRFGAAALRSGSATVKLLQQLHEDGARQVDSGRLRYLARQVRVGDDQGTALGECLGLVSELRLQHRRQLPSLWVESFNLVLQAWQWPGPGPLDSLEYQQVEAWYKVLEDFASHDDLLGELGLSASLALLRRCCQGRISQPQTASSPIQVLGPLEAAGLQFDSIWFCGLQANRWPAPTRPNPFIPMTLQRRFHMPHSSSEREWKYASTLMTQYRAGCRQMIGSYARQLDGVPELPSPLLERGDIVDIQQTSVVHPHWSRQAALADLQRITDDRGPALSPGEGAVVQGGSGLLQQQASCPFRAFASKRLQLEPLGDYRAGLSSADRGSILHDALYVLWGDIGDSEQLATLTVEARQQCVQRAAAAAVEKVPEHLRLLVGMHCLDLEGQRLQALLLQWLELEDTRAPFKVLAREQPVSLQLHDLALQLRVDRIDELADGSRLVIDYKSGRNSLSDWLGGRPAQPQLPLYGLAEEVSGLAFAEVRSRDGRFLGLGDIDGVPGVQNDIAKGVKRYSGSENWRDLLGEWQQNLSRLAEEFLAGKANVDPLPGACNYCGMEAVCRVQIASQEILP